MARAPRASVPKTSGQGVARRSYQQGYAKGNRGTADAGGAVPSVSGSKATITEENLKRGGGGGQKMTGKSGINVSYGDTLPIGTLADVSSFGKGKPAHSKVLEPKLPDRNALKDLGKTQHTIHDYAKRTPIRK